MRPYTWAFLQLWGKLYRCWADPQGRSWSYCPSRRLRGICEDLRLQRKAAIAPHRYETGPGQQMQIDFAEKYVNVGGEAIKVHFLSLSRRIFVNAYPAENQGAWLNGIESAFIFFGGVPACLLSDNSKCLVTEHRNGLVKLALRYENFCQY